MNVINFINRLPCQKTSIGNSDQYVIFLVPEEGIGHGGQFYDVPFVYRTQVKVPVDVNEPNFPLGGNFVFVKPYFHNV